jgi:ADP-heptose:LPS heptosyltransferase
VESGALTRLLVVRLDSLGDVLLTGPAIAVAASRTRVDVLCSSIGQPAAELLPGVDRTIVFDAPWILNPAPPLEPDVLRTLVDDLASRRYGAAAILTSSHQSALPTAMVLRLAGLPRLAAVSNDYPGALLDHRIPGDPDVHEVERALAVMAALDFPVGDPAEHRLRIDVPPPRARSRRVVVHPGAAAPARTLSPSQWRGTVDELGRRGFEVLVTGTEREAALCQYVAEESGARRVVLAPGQLRRFAQLVGSASVVVTGNTGPAHLAAAMGRPVAAVFPPTVPPNRWRPWGVPHVLLGDLDVACAGCRSLRCPLPEQICVAGVSPVVVADAVETLSFEQAAPRVELPA